MAAKKDKSTQELRDAKNAANVAGLTKLYPPKKAEQNKGRQKEIT